MTTPVSNINRTNLNALDPNLATGQVADPALRKACFDEVYNYFDTFVAAYNAFIANGGVVTANIGDLAVTTAKIALGAVTAAQMASAAIGTGQIADSAVTSVKIADDTIVNADINSAAAISWSKISKSLSSLADLATRSATDLNSGTLNVARLPTAIPATNIGNGDVTNAILSFLNTLTSNAQTQLDAKVPLAQKGVANGVASLDSGAKVPIAQLPDAVLGALEYQGTWNASTNTPTLTSTPTTIKGYYYVVSAAGTQFSLTFDVGDWIVSNGSVWQKVDNTDAVTNFNGRLGAIVPTTGDYTWGQINKTVSSLLDLATRSASDLSSGTLPDARRGARTGDVTSPSGSGVNTIAANAVTTAKIADLNVTTGKLADANVTTGKLEDLAVTTAKINDLGITTGKIADGAITSAKLDPSINVAGIPLATHQAANPIDHPDGSVTEPKLDANLTKKVNNPNSLLYSRALNGVVPPNSLNNALIAIKQKLTLKVAFVGDSITEGNNLNNMDDCYASRLTVELAKYLPNVTITTQNFGLASRFLGLYNDPNFKGLASEPSDTTTGFFRSWSTVGLSWKDTVKAFSPDLVILAFGMNDSNETANNIYTADVDFANDLTTALVDFNTWPTIPNIALVTTILPTTNTTLYTQRQDVTNAVARATRIFGKNNMLAVADTNRLFRILRDGYDGGTSSSVTEKNWVNYPTGYSGNTAGYSLAGSTLNPSTGGVITRTKTFFNGIITLSISASAVGDPGVTRIDYRVSDLGQFTVYVYAGTGSTGYIRLYKYESPAGYVDLGYTLLQEVTGLTIQVGVPVVIKIIAKDDNHQVYVAGTKQIDQTSYSNMHDGNISMGSVSTNVATLSNLTINYEDPAYGSPIYTEADLLGLHVAPYDAGNGINHPSPFGHAIFYLSAFQSILRELASSSLVSLSNFIINGNFNIWQRASTFTNPANLTFTSDRYKISIVNSGTLPTSIVHSRQALSGDEIPNSAYFYRIAQNGAGSGFVANDIYAVSQTIENGVRYLCGLGKKVTISFFAKSDIAGKRIGVGFQQVYGTGSPTAVDVVTGINYTLTTAWKKYVVTLQTVSVAGKTFSTSNDDYILFSLITMWGVTRAPKYGATTAETFVGAGNIDIAQIQINAGDKVIPFQAKNMGEEMDLCRRYYQQRSTNSIGQYDLSPPMRISPTITGASSPYSYDAEL